MAKKSKRQVRKRPSTRTTMRNGEFNPDYTAIIKDLKTIGLLAGFFISVLLIISFFLH